MNIINAPELRSATERCITTRTGIAIGTGPAWGVGMNHTLHQQLVELRSQAEAWLEGEKPEGFCPELGICENLPNERRKCGLLRDMMSAWPGGSGDEGYPVPHHDKGSEGGYTHSGAPEMWNPQHEYARNRWALLEWLIEQTASEADQ